MQPRPERQRDRSKGEERRHQMGAIGMAGSHDATLPSRGRSQSVVRTYDSDTSRGFGRACAVDVSSHRHQPAAIAAATISDRNAGATQIDRDDDNREAE